MSGTMLLDLTQRRKHFQSLAEGHSRSCTLWEDEYVRVMPGECDTIIRKMLEELFISSDCCGSSLHKQLLLSRWIRAHLGCPYKPTSHRHSSLSCIPASLQPPWEPGVAQGMFLHPQGCGEQADTVPQTGWQPFKGGRLVPDYPPLSPKLEAERATRKSGESCLSRKGEAASQSSEHSQCLPKIPTALRSSLCAVPNLPWLADPQHKLGWGLFTAPGI